MNKMQDSKTPTKQSPIDAASLTTTRISERLQAILDRLPADLPPSQQAKWFCGNTDQAVKL